MFYYRKIPFTQFSMQISLLSMETSAISARAYVHTAYKSWRYVHFSTFFHAFIILKQTYSKSSVIKHLKIRSSEKSQIRFLYG